MEDTASGEAGVEGTEGLACAAVHDVLLDEGGEPGGVAAFDGGDDGV